MKISSVWNGAAAFGSDIGMREEMSGILVACGVVRRRLAERWWWAD